MKAEKNFLQRGNMAEALPADVFPKMPIVEIFGNKRVLVENHRGVIGYSNSEISVCTHCGLFSIRGSMLEIVKMTKYQLVITGSIASVFCSKGR